MAHDVFISYSKKDKLVADAACVMLEARGIRCWIAPRDVLPGMDWGGSIINAITESRVMVLIFSSSANVSAQIKREVNQAIEKEVAVIPFRIEDVTPSGALEYYLDVTHWLDALTEPLEQHLEKLAEDVNQLLKKPSTSPEISLPRKDIPAPKRGLVLSRNKLFLIGGIVAAILIAVLTTVLIMRGRSTPQPRPIAQQENRWFVIFGTFAGENRDGANRHLEEVKAKGFDARIIDTNQYPNFTPNRLAIVMGPYSETAAMRVANQVRFLVPSVKAGW
jgi:TIR domain